MTDTDEVRRALATWAAGEPLARGDLARVELRGLQRADVLRVLLVSRYETRTLAFAVEPTHASGAPFERDPDPWELGPDVPADAPVGTKVSEVVGLPYERACIVCSGMGTTRCAACGGSGAIGRSPCGVCGGSGQLFCRDCRGTGAVLATPSVITAVAEVASARVLEPTEVTIDTDAFVELQSATGGEVLHADEGERIAGASEMLTAAIPRAQQEPVRKAAAGLVAASHVPAKARPRGERLEVRRVPAWTFELDGRHVVVLATAPHVAPADALRIRSAKVLRSAGRGALVIAKWAGFLLLGILGLTFCVLRSCIHH